MNGKLARKLRKVVAFNPHAERFYKQLKNANNYAIGEDGQLERVGGTWLEVTEKGDLVTSRSRYKYLKEKYYDGAF